MNLPDGHEQQDAHSHPNQFVDREDKRSVGLPGTVQPETGKKHDKKSRSDTYSSQLISIHCNSPLILDLVSSFYTA
jgi:hypothetical protein